MIYVSSSCLKNKYIVETVRQLAEHGIKNIELSGGTEYYDDLENDLKRQQRIYGLNYTCHAYFPPHKNDIVVNLASCNDDIYRESIQHYKDCIAFLNRLEIRTLSIHAGFFIEISSDEIGKLIKTNTIYNKENSYERFICAYENIRELCLQNDIRLYLENNVLSEENYRQFRYRNYLMMTDSGTIAEMKKKLEFNLLLDYGHLCVSSGTLGLSFQEECGKLGREAGWIHVSDNNGVKDLHLPLNQKSEIMKEVKRNHRIEDINITLETVGTIKEISDSIHLISG